MFVQVIKGRTSDADGINRQLDRWSQELAPGAEGWLGATWGVTDDGTFLSVVRFSSEEAARRNSDRPEQGAWWSETEKYFDGDVTFHDCRDVELVMDGGSNDAGFVQIIEGTIDDSAAAKAAQARVQEILPRVRSDVIGGVMAHHGDGGFTQAMYFTSEEEARKGEAAMAENEESAAAIAELRSHGMGEPQFYDLRTPRFMGD
ncbi:MAG TPA: hypothetical protein VM784_00410 [Actinomycetota bacterium]|nr:hypothetical protein [Actinomycetota bacterium]